jgi:hypothetical protein
MTLQDGCIVPWIRVARWGKEAMSSVSGTRRPTFPCAWLERNSDRLSFGFQNLTSTRTTSTTARTRTVKPLSPDKPHKYSRSLSPAN